MNSVPKVVFTNTLEAASWSNTRLVEGRAEGEVVRLQQEPGEDPLILGSVDLTDLLTTRGLVDEYRIGLNPILLGQGNPMFKPGDERLTLTLLEARPMKSGVVLLRYGRP